MENDIEVDAQWHGGLMGGEYLEELKKTDLATLSKEEWQMFLQCVCRAYHLKLVEFQSEHEKRLLEQSPQIPL